jgi:antitoxin component of MazEF toxin-antitoxin module
MITFKFDSSLITTTPKVASGERRRKTTWVLPTALADALHAAGHDRIRVDVEGDQIILTPYRKGDPAMAVTDAITMDEDREKIISEIATAIREANAMWERGEMTSPSQRDYVIDARKILSRYPDFPGTTEEGEEFVADVLYEDAGEKYVTDIDIATYLYEALTAE